MYNINKEFSDSPHGRFIKDGEFSGEEFYKVLEELYFNDKHIKINFDGTYGFGKGFLYQSIGKFKESHMDVVFTFESYENRSLLRELTEIIDNAKFYINNKDSFYDVAKEFTATPGGRFNFSKSSDVLDKFSGESFRDVLIELYKKSKHIKIDISGLETLPPGFAEESFGGFAEMYLKAIFHIRSDSNIWYINDINNYVNSRRKKYD